MILGCGIDVMEISRFEREVARRGGDLAGELFHAAELSWCRRRRRPVEGYAMGFAAKEALFKALGTGKTGRMAWSDVEISWPARAGRPEVALSGETAAVAGSLGVANVHLALAACREYGMAWVVVTGRGSWLDRSPLSSGELRLASLRSSTGSGRPELAEGRAEGKRPGRPRPDAGESRAPNPESRRWQENG